MGRRDDLVRIRLRQLRLARGWSQGDLSRASNGVFSQSRIGNYEQGTRAVGVEEAIAFARLLDTSAAHVLCLDEDQPVLSPEEIELIRAFRALPENQRNDYRRRITALATAYRDPVPDERLDPAWRAPAAEYLPAPPKRVKPPK